MVISEASYTIKIINMSDGCTQISKSPNGFRNDFELLGILKYVIATIENNMLKNNTEEAKKKK